MDLVLVLQVILLVTVVAVAIVLVDSGTRKERRDKARAALAAKISDPASG